MLPILCFQIYSNNVEKYKKSRKNPLFRDMLIHCKSYYDVEQFID